MSPFSIPIRRPVATSMLFLGIVLLGILGWNKLPVELIPPLEGNRLIVNFARPGSEPEVVERELLLPLSARVAELAGVEETWGSVRGSRGDFTVRFSAATDMKVRELEMRRTAAELQRTQPPGTFIDVSAVDLTLGSRFAMTINASGFEDPNVLRDFLEQHIEHRLAAVPEVSQVLIMGGSPREVTVLVDPDRCAALGVTPDEVAATIRRAVGRPAYAGGTEDEIGRTAVIVDGRMPGITTLANTRVRLGQPVLLRHVADIEIGAARVETISRVDGKRAVGIVVFQNEGANLIRLGQALYRRIAQLNEEFAVFGVELTPSFDASELVRDRLDRLKKLGASGFVIALLVLFLFLRQWRAVAVVGVAVPVSLLTALCLMYIGGQSLNLITIFGLAVGIGMLVDNSIVVYEAVQRQLEHGATADAAAEEGVHRTVRAILAATLTTAVVFLPITFIDFDEALFREFLEVMVISILLPLFGSVVVAVGLVPLLARWLAAPAALARLESIRKQKREFGGLRAPERSREVFGKLLMVTLRRPAGWVTGVIVAVMLTVVIALPWVTFSSLSQEPPEANPVQLAVQLPSEANLDKAGEIFTRLEEEVMALEGIERVESFIREENGTLTVYLEKKEDRPEDVNAARVRRLVRASSRNIDGVEIRNPGESSGGGGGGGGGGLTALLGQGPAEIKISGPDTQRLNKLAEELSSQLESIGEIASASPVSRRSQEELQVVPNASKLASFALTGDQVLPALNVVRREGVSMQIGYTQHDGREIPLTLRRKETQANAGASLRDLRLATPAGSLPLSAFTDVRQMPPPVTIQHHNGRREISINYSYSPNAPQTGPGREALERQVQASVQAVHRPAGYTIETPKPEGQTEWFKRILIPVILLLLAVLAITFESLTMPLLVLIALPLTMLGATWALVLARIPAGPMALVGTLALIGLTVNPAILLVDRMQQRVRGGARSAGAAALAAVRERARPVIMTTATTVAGLWPLAIVTGREDEIWPPFATVVMGGLVTSTLLTLLVIPVGFVFLHRLDRVFGRLGPWIMIAWVLATATAVTPLFVTGLISTMTWRILTTILIASILLAVAVLIFRKPEKPEPHREGDRPPDLDVRFLKKVYGKPGPIAYAWRLPEIFARKVLARGGNPFNPMQARRRVAPLLLVAVAALFLSTLVQSGFWNFVLLFASAFFGIAMLKEIRRSRGKVDELGRVLPRGPEGAAAVMLPWVAWSYLAIWAHVIPKLAEEPPRFRLWFIVTLAVIIFIVQFGRHTALQLARKEITESPGEGRMRWVRGLWRSISRRVFGLDIPKEQVKALTHLHFKADRGMIGVLGPNGAGKTTMLRQVAGILEPSVGKIFIGGVPLEKLKRHLARYIGYLPQEFGLPVSLTAREYLEYYALLYEIKPLEKRRDRVERLLQEVGLGDRADEKISGYSGGMRQRVAVARTLLRLPPIIIVDEPTVGLDPRERIRFRNLLSRLAEGRIILFSTHVVEDVAVACERVMVLSKGRQVFDGDPMDLSELADGKVWKAKLLEEERDQVASDAKVVDEVPEGGGIIRLRILSDARPHPAAEPEQASLEDGYLVLTGAAG